MCACQLAEVVQGGLCRRCWAAQLGQKRRVYSWTPELHAELRKAYSLRKLQRAAAIDALERRTGWPRHAFWEEAVRLGLSRSTKRPWTEQEDAFLVSVIGKMAIGRIASAMGRKLGSVSARANALSLSRRIRNGYAVADLAAMFGAPASRVRSWIARGLFGKPLQAPDGVRVAGPNVLRFIRKYPAEIDFKLADQTLLKGVLFGQ
jgi:DNA-directed RNA polymerase specialized sigma24 family protein